MTNEEYKNRLRVAIDFLLELDLYDEASMLRARLENLDYMDRISQPTYGLSGIGFYGLDQILSGVESGWIDDRLVDQGLVVFDVYKRPETDPLHKEFTVRREST